MDLCGERTHTVLLYSYQMQSLHYDSLYSVTTLKQWTGKESNTAHAVTVQLSTRETCIPAPTWMKNNKKTPIPTDCFKTRAWL